MSQFFLIKKKKLNVKNVRRFFLETAQSFLTVLIDIKAERQKTLKTDHPKLSWNKMLLGPRGAGAGEPAEGPAGESRGETIEGPRGGLQREQVEKTKKSTRRTSRRTMIGTRRRTRRPWTREEN